MIHPLNAAPSEIRSSEPPPPKKTWCFVHVRIKKHWFYRGFVALKTLKIRRLGAAPSVKFGGGGSKTPCFNMFFEGRLLNLGERKKKKKKTKNNKHKGFWRDTWCASRLSRGHVPSVPWYVPWYVPGTFCPFSSDLHINHRPKCPRCPWDVPSLSLGRLRGIRPPKSFMWFFFIGFFSRTVLGSSRAPCYQRDLC